MFANREYNQSNAPCKGLAETVHISLPPRIRAILEEVSAETGVSVGAILGQIRKRKVVRPRQEAMRRCRDLRDPQPSLPQIGAWFGGRDHTTVIHAIRTTAR